MPEFDIKMNKIFTFLIRRTNGFHSPDNFIQFLEMPLKYSCRNNYHNSPPSSSPSSSSPPSSALPSTSTIFSLCSGSGKCGVSVFRISGPDASHVLHRMTSLELKSSDNKRKSFRYAKILHSQTQNEIDHGLVLWFPGPNSLTGEDVCELQTHGGPAIKKKILDSLSSLDNFRPAQPGEFIKRSFENGKLDLTQVEGLHDLVNAENDDQHVLALNMFKGHTKNIYNKWMDIIIQDLAHLEALIDFGEEDNLDEQIFHNVKLSVRHLLDEISKHLNDSQIYERMKDGMKICIIGKPNVGKRTTRDVIEVTLDFEGHSLVVSDTAGMRRDADDVVERLGIERAVNCFQEADVVVLVLDPSYENIEELINQTDVCSESSNLIENSMIADCLNKINLDESSLRGKSLIVVFNKSDLIDEEHLEKLKLLLDKLNGAKLSMFDKHKTVDELKLMNQSSQVDTRSEVLTSSKWSNNVPSSMMSSSSSLMTTFCLASCYGENGLNDFEDVLRKCVRRSFDTGPNLDILSINARHRHYLKAVTTNLSDFLTILSSNNEDQGEAYDIRLELSTEKLRNALQNMGCITGKVVTDQILDRIFSNFCIGK